jgi:hypothetical protein
MVLVMDTTVEQAENSQENIENKKGKASHLAPWQFKKGQSGNPLGRTPGKSLKEYAKEYLASLTDEERLDYFEGMNKAEIWKMAEGNPQTNNDLTSGGEKVIFQVVNYGDNKPSPQI